MAWNGSGTFTRTDGVYTGSTVWQQDAAAGVKIRADRHDTHDQDLATGINTCLTKDGQNAATANLNLGGNRFTLAGNSVQALTDLTPAGIVQQGSVQYIADSGTANAYIVVLAPVCTALTAGQPIRFRVGNTNTGASTLTVNSLTAKNIVRRDGSTLASGDLLAGAIATVVYDGTSDNFELQGVGSPSNQPIRLITSSTSISVSDRDGIVLVTSGSPTITFLGQSAAGAGFPVIVANEGTGTAILASGTSDTFNGNATLSIGPRGSVKVVADGISNWQTASSSPLGTQTIGAPVKAWTTATTNGATSITSQTGTNLDMLVGFRFDNATNQSIQLLVSMPKSWDRSRLPTGSLMAYAESGTGVAKFAFQALAFDSGMAIDQAFGSQETGTMTFAASSQWSRATISGINVSGASAKTEDIIIQMTRLASDSADTAGTCIVVPAHILYNINRSSDA